MFLFLHALRARQNRRSLSLRGAKRRGNLIPRTWLPRKLRSQWQTCLFCCCHSAKCTKETIFAFVKNKKEIPRQLSYKLSLHLFVFWSLPGVFTDNPDFSAPPDNLALGTNFFHRGSYFHFLFWQAGRLSYCLFYCRWMILPFVKS